MIFASNAWWQAPSPAHQRAIESAAQVAEQADFELAARASADAVEALRAGGMTIHVQTAAERAAWEKALVGPLTMQFVKQSPDAAKVLALVKGL